MMMQKKPLCFRIPDTVGISKGVQKSGAAVFCTHAGKWLTRFPYACNCEVMFALYIMDCVVSDYNGFRAGSDFVAEISCHQSMHNR